MQTSIAIATMDAIKVTNVLVAFVILIVLVRHDAKILTLVVKKKLYVGHVR